MSKRMFLAVLLFAVPLIVEAASGRQMDQISQKWSCEFKNDPNSNKLSQGIECNARHGCRHPAQENQITYSDLNDFAIDFKSKTISYVHSTRWFPAARQRAVARLKAEGKRDDTGRIESDSPRSYKIRSVSSTQGAFEDFVTITFVDENQAPAFLFVKENGKRAVITRPIAIADFLSVVHYFGACHPQ